MFRARLAALSHACGLQTSSSIRAASMKITYTFISELSLQLNSDLPPLHHAI